METVDSSRSLLFCEGKGFNVLRESDFPPEGTTKSIANYPKELSLEKKSPENN